MEILNIAPTFTSYLIVLDTLAHYAEWEKLNSFRERLKTTEFSPHIAFYNLTLKGMKRLGKLAEMEEIFDEMRKSNIKMNGITYSILVEVYAMKADIESIHAVFADMKSRQIPIDATSYAALMHTFARLGRIEDAMKVFQEMKAKKMIIDSTAFNVVLETYANAGDTTHLREFWQEMTKQFKVQPTEESFIMKVESLFKNKQLSEAVAVLDEMNKYQVSPNKFFHVFLTNWKRYMPDHPRHKEAEKFWSIAKEPSKITRIDRADIQSFIRSLKE